MRNIFTLSAANLRKSKSQAISLVLLVTIAAMFLYMGFVMFFGMGRFFDERAEQLNAPHYTVFTNNAERIELIKNFDGVGEVEIQEVVAGFTFFGGSMNALIMAFARVDENLKLNPLAIVGDALPLEGNAIYLPHGVMLGSGLRLGDDIVLSFSGTELYFVVAGSHEDIMGSRLYVSEAAFYRIWQKFPNNRQNLVSARRAYENQDFGYLQLLGWEVANLTSSDENDAEMEGFSRQRWQAENAALTVPQIAAVFMTAFAVILLVVCLIVIRFRIINDIEENMTNIGTLKAVGFRNVQIILSIMLQFGTLAFFGGILGLAASQFVLPFATGIVEPMLGLRWIPSFYIYYALASLVAVLLVASLTSLLSSRKINKLHPIVALRGGITTHSFKKNPLPLETSPVPLGLSLSLKQILQSKRQAVMIGLIMAALMFASTAGIAVHYNLNVERMGFFRMMLGEIPDAAFVLNDIYDSEAFHQSLQAHPDVRSVFGFDSTDNPSVFVGDGLRTLIIVVEDFGYLEGSLLISGRYPRHNNEVALAAMLMSGWGRQIGDTVMLGSTDFHGAEKEFVITGVIQTVHNGGFTGILSADAFREIQPDFVFSQFYAYLADGADHRVFLEAVRAEHGDILLISSILEDMINVEDLEVAGSIFAAIAAATISVTAVIIVLVLFLVIKTVILRKRRELGIKKALGFTTLQLMNQVAFNLTPIIFLGVAAGAAAGYFGFNPVFVMLTQSMGIAQANLPIPISWVLIVCAALVLLAYAVSMLIAWRIRKISAYGLINE